jgi:hypothetical protein
MYKQHKNPDGTVVQSSVFRLSDMTCIPFDPANTDAQEFASWLWAGNKPESAEEGGTVADEWVEETLNKFGYKSGVGG